MAVLGAGLIFLVMSDALLTTLGIRGGGRLSRWVARTCWNLVRRIEYRAAGHQLRSVSGPVILLLTLLLWLVLLWTGWTLFFGLEPRAVIQEATGRPAGFIDRAYFVGYTLFTLGIGDMVPEGGFWQVATTIATVNGFFAATLAVAYVIPTLSAAVAMRRLAAWISTMGETPQELLVRAWDGSGFTGLGDQLLALIPEIEHHTQRHHAYPIVHYFHRSERRTAIGLSIAALDEALAILLYAVPPESRPPVSILRSLRNAIAGLLDTLRGGFVRSEHAVPPAADLSGLEALGVSVDPTWRTRLEADSERRSLLLAFVRDGGGRWFGGEGP